MPHKQQLQAYLGRITQPVEIVAMLDDSEAARDMRALLEDVASLSSLVRLEARAANRVDHAHIVEIHDVGETEDGDLYLVMEYLVGSSLSSKMAVVGHSGSHAPQSMHSSGLMAREFLPS